jgi:hypothetical protein
MKTLLWLDDTRNPYMGAWLYKYAPEYEIKHRVVWNKTYVEFVKWIETNGLPDMIAFDHDLGIEEGSEEMNGHDCAKWLVEYCIDNDKTPPKWVVQSDNPVGRDNINGLLLNFVRKFKAA